VATNFNELVDRLWNAADKLRANTHLRSSEYSVPVLGLIFLKFADQRFAVVDTILQERQHDAARPITLGPAHYIAQGAIYLDPSARFGQLRKLSTGVDAAVNTGTDIQGKSALHLVYSILLVLKQTMLTSIDNRLGAVA
jgi:type I restriction enzyme M protein